MGYKEEKMKNGSDHEKKLVKSWLNEYPQKAIDQILAEKHLPDPEVLWEKALSHSKKESRSFKKALRPIVVAQAIGIAVIMVVIGIFLFSGPLAESPYTQAFFKGIEMFFTLNPLAILTLFAIFLYMLATEIGVASQH